MIEEIIVPEEWKDVVSQVELNKGVVLILGGSDTGKTTFCRYLVGRLSKSGKKIAFVDGDMGQSTLGPPTTIGMAMFENPSSCWKEIPVTFMRFVGSISPTGHLVQTLVALKKMVDKSLLLGAEIVIVDTTGLIYGPFGRELKFQKIDLINPNHILALQKADEIETILLPHLGNTQIEIHRLKVLSWVRPKSALERQRHREGKLKEYFKKTSSQEISLRGVGIHGMMSDLSKKERFKGLLIGLCDELNDTLALGIIENIDLKKGKLSVLSPSVDLVRVRTIQFGSIRLNHQGHRL